MNLAFVRKLNNVGYQHKIYFTTRRCVCHRFALDKHLQHRDASHVDAIMAKQGGQLGNAGALSFEIVIEKMPSRVWRVRSWCM